MDPISFVNWVGAIGWESEQSRLQARLTSGQVACVLPPGLRKTQLSRVSGQVASRLAGIGVAFATGARKVRHSGLVKGMLAL